MIRLRDRKTTNLFDLWEYLGEKRRKLLDKCWAGVFRNHLLDHLPVEQLAYELREGLGRPSKDLHVVLGALVLQQLHDLTDAETVEAVAFNIAWHYALDIQQTSDRYVCERTLRTYRGWVIDKGLDEELFELLTDRLIRAFGVDTSRQRMDSTAVRLAMRTLTRLGILVETVSKFLRELERHEPRLYAQVDEAVINHFVKKSGACFGYGKPSESKHRLPEVAQVLSELVMMYENTTASTLDSYQLMARVFNEQCERVSDEEESAIQIKSPAQIPSDTLQNPSDPDASYNTHRGTGYWVQVVETYSPSGMSDPAELDLIIYVDVQKMTQHDSKAIEPALVKLESRAIKPDVLLGDSHYGSADSLQRTQNLGVEMVAPAMPAKGYKTGRLALENFELDEQGGVSRCPLGEAPLKTSWGTYKIEVFSINRVVIDARIASDAQAIPKHQVE